MHKFTERVTANTKPISTIKFTNLEANFLADHEICRLATANENTPHIAPVSYIFQDGKFAFATDYQTKKYRNIVKNNKVAIVVDTYQSSTDNKAVVIEGNAEILEGGPEFKRLYKKFYERFEWVRKEPWKQGEAPIVIVTATHKVSWRI
jgi:nitroimidazol reductase NimA-like FMN-containing flavoprotein (pyridoxamine 5'-phosphate oxidase superfamily)